MKLLNYEELPQVIKKKFKEKHLNELNKLYDSMGIKPNEWNKKTAWDMELKETFFIKEQGDVYFYFKPIKIFP